MPEPENETNLPHDADGPIENQAGSDFTPERMKRLVQIADGWIEAGTAARKPNAVRYLEGFRFYRGDQNGVIKPESLEWEVNVKDVDGGRHHRVSNKIRGYVRKHETRASSASLYTVAVPLMANNPVDVAAAEQANSFLSHSHRILNRKKLLARAQKRSIAGGPQFFHHYFEKNAVVPVVELGDDGVTTKAIHEVEAGEIKCELVPWSQMLVDPLADCWEDARWIVHQKARPLSYIRTRWEKARDLVLGAEKTQAESEQDTDNRASGRGGGEHDESKQATVDTILVKPHGFEHDGVTYGFPNGLYLVKVGSDVLEVSDWPFTHLKDERGEIMFPFEPLMFEESLDGFWGDNAVTPLVPLQRTRNQMVTALDANAKSGDGKLLVRQGALLKPDSFKNGANNEIVPFAEMPGDEYRGFPAQWLPTPDINRSVVLSINQIDRDMDEIGEVHDADRGVAASATESGKAVLARQDASMAAGASFHALTATCVYNSDLIALGLAKQFYKERRLITVQDRTDKDAPPQAMAQSFSELSTGRFVLDVRSQVPQSLAAKTETILQLLGANAFATENLEATLPLMKLLNLDEGDKMVSDWINVIEVQIARKNEEENKAAQLQQQMQEMQQKHEAERLAAETDSKIQIEAAKTEFEMKLAEFERRLNIAMPLPVAEPAARGGRNK